jgi:hypothetical protein
MATLVGLRAYRPVLGEGLETGGRAWSSRAMRRKRKAGLGWRFEKKRSYDPSSECALRADRRAGCGRWQSRAGSRGSVRRFERLQVLQRSKPCRSASRGVRGTCAFRVSGSRRATKPLLLHWRKRRPAATDQQKAQAGTGRIGISFLVGLSAVSTAFGLLSKWFFANEWIFWLKALSYDASEARIDSDRMSTCCQESMIPGG